MFYHVLSMLNFQTFVGVQINPAISGFLYSLRDPIQKFIVKEDWVGD